MNIDQLISGYKRALLTRGELFGWLTERLSEHPEELPLAWAAVDFEPQLKTEFGAWLEHLKKHPKILHHGSIITPSDELLRALF